MLTVHMNMMVKCSHPFGHVVYNVNGRTISEYHRVCFPNLYVPKRYLYLLTFFFSLILYKPYINCTFLSLPLIFLISVHSDEGFCAPKFAAIPAASPVPSLSCSRSQRAPYPQ